MIRLTKSEETPNILLSSEVEEENSKLAGIAANGGIPESSDFKAGYYTNDEVKDLLDKDQHNKCAYCELSLLDNREVEHYRPKTAYRQEKGATNRPAYYRLAYNWDNLFACCHSCNRKKGIWFPLENPEVRFDLALEKPMIINPYTENPEDHIEFRQEWLYPKNGKGHTTIEKIGLNRKELVELRRRALREFTRTAERQGLTYDEMLKQRIENEKDDGRDAESIEFYGMYTNQVFKF